MEEILEWAIYEEDSRMVAKASPYEYEIWYGNDSYSTLRIIRKDNAGGVIFPMYDFSINTSDVTASIELAHHVHNLFIKHAKYNLPITF
jgi:hypothetical protein